MAERALITPGEAASVLGDFTSALGNLRCWLQGCGQQETSGSRARLSLKIQGALSLSRGKRGTSHPYQLRAFLFHNSRIEPEPPLPRRTHGALCMVYLYLGFSIAPLYLAGIFFLYTRAGVRAPTRAHTALYMILLAASKGVFSLFHHYLHNLSWGFSLFLSVACKLSPARLGLCCCGSCVLVRTGEIKQRVNEISERRIE